ncbi:MAG: hypothetical protein KIT61_11950 [Pyrinomonadaceae bacterium]|nr:hypothetical protein [Blastocatellia bacterium]MCW5957291.1 hypothetical protein [Pyrinomonadaceae bacterium]
MPGSAKAEVIFIAAMMILILIISFTAVFFFARQYKREMAAKAENAVKRESEKAEGKKDAAS